MCGKASENVCGKASRAVACGLLHLHHQAVLVLCWCCVGARSQKLPRLRHTMCDRELSACAHHAAQLCKPSCLLVCACPAVLASVQELDLIEKGMVRVKGILEA